jgi:serine phosphatase RsbU (regulator of sigma subunit)/pSer/pThr/pTyr-binding forkhead associated (FHA) protein
MPALVTVRGPNAGRRFPLDERDTVIGRQPDAAIYLESLAVSRHHARVVCEGDAVYVEDLGSSNGTYVNGHKIAGRVPLGEQDTLHIGPYEMNLVIEKQPVNDSPAQVIRARVDAQPSNHTLFAQNAAQKLQVVLQIAQDLGQTLDIDPLLGLLLEHLLRLFPQADRGMVLLTEKEHLVVRAQRTRLKTEHGDYPYSRTIVRKALEEGVGLLSEDVRGDRNLVLSATLVSLNLRSFLCVPLIGWEGRRMGVIQLDCLRAGQQFRQEDLEMLTAIGLQAAVVLQNAAYHVERLREERLRQEIMMARDIQQQFLPDGFAVVGPTAELYARCVPAREVSGDLYDFFRLPDGRVAFFVGDVSGKGMPAALFMIAVRTLSRHLAPATGSAAEFLQRLNQALAADNPTHLFVTMVYGIYDGRDGSVSLAVGGHPPPLLRRPTGEVEVVSIKPAMLLGSAPVPLKVSDTRVALGPGETLVLYTDGYHEATAPDGKTEFGIDGLREALGGPRTSLPLDVCAAETSAIVRRFTGRDDLQDDQTLLLLRRR